MSEQNEKEEPVAVTASLTIKVLSNNTLRYDQVNLDRLGVLRVCQAIANGLINAPVVEPADKALAEADGPEN